MNDITEQDVKVFTDAVTEYFDLLGIAPASIHSFYLACEEAAAPVGDLTGIIALGGDFRGTVSFAAPRGMIRFVLRSQRSTDDGDDQLLDAVGEIANTIAGNARRYFGRRLDISVPVTRLGGVVPGAKGLRERQFVIVVDWLHFHAAVVVDMEHKVESEGGSGRDRKGERIKDAARDREEKSASLSKARPKE